MATSTSSFGNYIIDLLTRACECYKDVQYLNFTVCLGFVSTNILF